VGGAISVRFIAPWAASSQRAQQRWEDDLVSLGDLLAWELPEAVKDLTDAWDSLKEELLRIESLESRGSVQAQSRITEVTRNEDVLKRAMVSWQRLASSRLEWLARRVEHRHTPWGERSVLTARARLYRLVFSPIGGPWNQDAIGGLDKEFETEKMTRETLLEYVLKLEADLWPSREPFGKRVRQMFNGHSVRGTQRSSRKQLRK
jgi:hypothetical protein